MKMPKEWWVPREDSNNGGIEPSNKAPYLIWGNNRSGVPNYKVVHIGDPKRDSHSTYCGTPDWYSTNNHVTFSFKTVEHFELCGKCYRLREKEIKEQTK